MTRNVEKEKNKMNKNIKRNDGITLIALVITIIILLILAGVTIAALTGDNGILGRATDAREQTDVAEEKEKVVLAAQAALIDNNGKEILEQYLNSELENNFGENKYSLEEGQNNGEQGFIVTITDTGRRYFVNKNGKVEQMIPAPIVTHTINPETQVTEGEKITITINATPTEGEITKITKPDGTSVENTTTTTYQVEENGEYKFVVEQSNGGKTIHTVEITNGKYVEKFSDIYTSTQAYTKNGQTAWIPEGFAVGTSNTINTIENGLVITDKIDENHNSIGNEFVWVPVNRENFDTEFVRIEGYGSGEQGLSPNYGEADGNSETGENTNSNVKETETTKTEVKEMYESVYNNEGFYIGRYETGIGTNSNAVIQKNVRVYNNIKWSANGMQETTGTTGGAVEVSRNFDTANKYTSVTSTLIYGVQWDTTMKWMENVQNLTGGKYIQDSTGMGWYSGNSPYSTGTNLGEAKNRVKNIYDLAGNVYEWSMESYSSNRRVWRGGSHKGSGIDNPASNRTSNRYGSSYSGTELGFRITLYLNR